MERNEANYRVETKGNGVSISENYCSIQHRLRVIPYNLIFAYWNKKGIRVNFVYFRLHNHPTGNPSPSESHRELTRDLVNLGLVMQIGRSQ